MEHVASDPLPAGAGAGRKAWVAHMFPCVLSQTDLEVVLTCQMENLRNGMVLRKTKGEKEQNWQNTKLKAVISFHLEVRRLEGNPYAGVEVFCLSLD